MANELKYHMNMLNSIDRKVGGPGNWQYIIDALNSIDTNLGSVGISGLIELAQNAYPSESASGNPIYLDDGADGIPVKELIVNLEPIQSGTGDPSPTNVRPITGYDGVNILRTGKNIVTATRSTFTESGITVTKNSDGVYTLNGTATKSCDLNLFPNGITNPIKKGSYIASGISGGSGSTYTLGFRINDSENNRQYALIYNGDNAFVGV